METGIIISEIIASVEHAVNAIKAKCLYDFLQQSMGTSRQNQRFQQVLSHAGCDPHFHSRISFLWRQTSAASWTFKNQFEATIIENYLFPG